MKRDQQDAVNVASGGLGHDHGDRVAAAGDQAGGGAVANAAELTNGPLDPSRSVAHTWPGGEDSGGGSAETPAAAATCSSVGRGGFCETLSHVLCQRRLVKTALLRVRV